MPSFQYTAISATGERIGGVVPAASEQAALAELEARRLTPIEVVEQSGTSGRRAGNGQEGAGRGASAGNKAQSRGAIGRGLGRLGSRGVGVRELATAYKQLADLIRAGVPLLRALRLIGGQKATPRVAAAFAELAAAVADGRELADAMGDRSTVFAPSHVAMVRAGEKGGFLEAVLARLGTMLEAQADLRAKLIGNLIYPCVLIVVGLGVVGAIFTVFVPQFRPMFSKLEEAGQLPALTRFVLNLSGSAVWYALALAVLLAVAGIALWRGGRSPRFQRRWLSIQRRVPVLGDLATALPTARLSRTLGTLLSNGVPLLAALRISKDSCGHVILEEAVESAAEAVGKGESLAQPLARSGLIADDIVEMISVGEASNNLDHVLLGVAETLEKRVDRLLTVAVRLVEPLLLMFLAGVVGLIAVALIVPITKLSQVVN